MDWIGVFIFVGLIFSGFIVGYPIGHLFGKREAEINFERDLDRTYEPCLPRKSADILDAEILEERQR